METVMAAAVTGVLSLAGVLVTAISANRRIQMQIKLSQAVTDTKLEELTREVREHNRFAQRMPVVEEKIQAMEHRLAELERKNQNAE